MELTGVIVEVLPLQSGTGRNGTWKKQDFILETQSQYPKKVCISMWGDKINESVLKQGNKVTAHFDVESREFNGKWYTDVKAWKVELQTQNQEQSSLAPSDFPPPPPENFDIGDDSDMPF